MRKRVRARGRSIITGAMYMRINVKREGINKGKNHANNYIVKRNEKRYTIVLRQFFFFEAVGRSGSGCMIEINLINK